MSDYTRLLISTGVGDLAYAPPYSTALDAPIIAGNLMAGKLHGKPCSCGRQGLE